MTRASWVAEETRYFPRCGGCGAEYGDEQPSLEAALQFIRDCPQCPACEPGETQT